MTIQTLIVDDEPLARKRARKMLAEFPDIELVGEAANGSEAVAAIEAKGPDLVLLDVQMPDLSGFDVLRVVETEDMPMVVFVTAHDEYALNAFEVAALDYLLKPVRKARLEEAIGKVRDRVASGRGLSRQLKKLLEITESPANEFLERIPARREGRILVVPTGHVAALRVDQGLVFIETRAGELWTKYTSLTQLEGHLDPNRFVRVHRQHIVNLDHVREVVAFDNATARLRLSTGSMTPVSRAHLRTLKKLLDL